MSAAITEFLNPELLSAMIVDSGLNIWLLVATVIWLLIVMPISIIVGGVKVGLRLKSVRIIIVAIVLGCSPIASIAQVDLIDIWALELMIGLVILLTLFLVFHVKSVTLRILTILFLLCHLVCAFVYFSHVRALVETWNWLILIKFIIELLIDLFKYLGWM